jgi:hypothetical protein
MKRSVVVSMVVIVWFLATRVDDAWLRCAFDLRAQICVAAKYRCGNNFRGFMDRRDTQRRNAHTDQ